MKEGKKTKVFKLVISIIFALAVLGAYGYVIWKGEPYAKPYLSYGAIGLCFLFSLLFIGKSSKKVFVTLALACNVAADYFLVFSQNLSDKNQLFGLGLFCGFQFFIMIYTLVIAKGNGRRVINLAIRVALCLMIGLILPKYVTLTTIQMIALMYIVNSLVNVVVLLFHLKKNFVLMLGLFLLLVCDVIVGFNHGGIEVFGITGKFVEFIQKYDWAYYVYTPSILLIALSSVWAWKEK